MKNVQALILVSVCAICLQQLGCLGSDSSGTRTASSGNGTSGSLARFILVDNFLYTVDNTSLRVFDCSGRAATYVTTVNLGFNIETVFNRKNTLFIGASDGVHIYDITNRTKPEFLSLYRHIFSCDPVVANDNYAFATLSTGRDWCWRGTNQMDIIDISNLRSPRLVKSVPLIKPLGLGLLNDKRLIVCNDGVEVYDISAIQNTQLFRFIRPFKGIDVIPGTDGFTSVSQTGIANFGYRNDTLWQRGAYAY